MLTPGQIRAARALLNMRQSDLAEASGVHVMTIKSLERGQTDARGSTLVKIQTALEKAGVEIITNASESKYGGPGVRMRNVEAKPSQ